MGATRAAIVEAIPLRRVGEAVDQARVNCIHPSGDADWHDRADSRRVGRRRLPGRGGMERGEPCRKGGEKRREMYGDASCRRANGTACVDPVMRRFLDMATGTVFGALWTRGAWMPGPGR